MTRMLTVAVACLALTMPAAPTSADELNRGWVAPDAEWVLHIDIERVLTSQIGESLRADADLQEARKEVLREVNFDMLEDMHGLTAYGRREWGERGVLIATTTAAADHLLEAVRAEALDYQSFEAGVYTIHSFDAEDGRVYAYLGRRGEGRVLVMSDDGDIVVETLGVMRDRERAYGGVDVPEGTLLIANATEFERLPDFDPTSQILREAERVSLLVREDPRDSLITQLTVGAESQQQAEDIADVVNGLLALGRLIAREEADLAFLVELAEGIKVEADGALLTLSITLTPEMADEIFRESRSQEIDWDWQGNDDWDDA